MTLAADLEPVGGAAAREDRSGIAERAFAILDYVANAGGPVTVADIVEQLGLPKATAHRLADSFVERGFLLRESGRKRLTVGPRLIDLALGVMRTAMRHAPRRAILNGLVHTIGETCNIGTMIGAEIVYLDRVEAQHWPLRLQFSAGSRVPLHCTAIGKLFLALLPQRQSAALIADLELARLTPKTITDRGRLDAALARIRADRFSTDDEEFLTGVVCIAVPILGPDREICAAVALQAPAARMSVADARRHLPILRAAAERLAASIRHD
ncbi:MAG TPA: IclR family transcriptional regulator [Stellaceae bacterium]|nr:IclR family transcriptional regulator [Stellaceae bacterium]